MTTIEFEWLHRDQYDPQRNAHIQPVKVNGRSIVLAVVEQAVFDEGAYQEQIAVIAETKIRTLMKEAPTPPKEVSVTTKDLEGLKRARAGKR